MEIKELKIGSKYILLSYDAPIIALGFEEYKEEAEVEYIGESNGVYVFEDITDAEIAYNLRMEQVEKRIIPTKLRPKDYEG